VLISALASAALPTYTNQKSQRILKPAQVKSDWTVWAKRFTGESIVTRNRAIQYFKKTKNLDSILRKKLQSDQQLLALDVIGTLRLKSLLPDLMQLSESDRTGMFYVTMNALITTSNKDAMTAFYLTRLGHRRTSTAARVVIIDTLNRLRVSIPKSLFKELLLEHSSPEVRGAALKYLRNLLRDDSSEATIGLLQKSLQDECLQLRVQALFIITELPKSLQIRFKNHLKSCIKDPNNDMLRLCQKLHEETLL
jgi:hypothetical protein